MNLKRMHVLMGITLLAAIVSNGDTLPRESVPAGSKWVLHIDMDGLRNSEIGDGLMKGIVADQADRVKKKTKLDLPAILNSSHSITIYGSDYESGAEGKGILLWRGDSEIEQIANAFLIQQAEATKAGEGSVKRVQENPFPIYSIDDEVRAAVVPGKGLILGRSQKQIADAVEVLNGNAKSLVSTESFKDYPELSGGFFLMAYAESFGESANVPPQAEVLKLTDGGRIAIGEENQNLLVQLILRARSEEVTQQIQQVIQGLLALATLSLGEEPGLQSIIRATRVNVDGRKVKLDLTFPLEEAMKQIEKTQDKDDEDE